MALILGKMKDSYNFVFYDLADERTKDMFPSPIFLITTLLFYLYFSKILGPRLMKDLKPFKLRSLMFYYNLFQIFICIYILRLGVFYGGWLTSYNIACQPVDMTDNPESRNMINAAWWYTTVKLIDLMDTVFFVLRKKDRQISFLHVFHHFMMPIASYIGMKYFPNGHATLVGAINCVIHVIMYTYYLIAGLGPQYQKYLWWKKHLTTMQIVQFGLIFIHNLVALLNSSCEYPKWISAVLCVHSLQFVYMFGNFYYVNYIKNPAKAAKTASGSTKVTNEKLKAH